jgi:hypothetical protein
VYTPVVSLLEDVRKVQMGDEERSYYVACPWTAVRTEVASIIAEKECILEFYKLGARVVCGFEIEEMEEREERSDLTEADES